MSRGASLRRLAVVGVLVAIAAARTAFPDPGAAWRRAAGPRLWDFPGDHGAHPEFQAEWWYFTGNLSRPGGGRMGYQLTIFRKGVRIAAADPSNPWSVRDLHLGHFTVTDVEAGVFRAEDLLSRSGPGLAGAATSGMDIWILGWSARMKGETIFLEARKNGLELRLELKPRKPVVLHGEQGFCRKGSGEGEASYHASLPNLETRGEIVLRKGGPKIVVSGTSWFDHEFGSGFLGASTIGWDWFSLHLSDGRELMIYRLRRADGSVEPASSGTLVDAAGKARYLSSGQFVVEILDRWRSPRSGGVYPGRWRLRLPGEEIDLVIEPLLADQELVSAGLPDLIYWEGAVAAKGEGGRGRITAEGYVELTGYAGNLRRVF